jgi:hypothetical protein
VKVSKPSLRDGDWLWQQTGVAVGLALLAVQAGSCPVGDVIEEPAPNKSEETRCREASLPGKVVQMQKDFSEYC